MRDWLQETIYLACWQRVERGVQLFEPDENPFADLEEFDFDNATVEDDE